jgi:hypothetical protein
VGDVVRSIMLGPDGAVSAGPETITLPGATGFMPQVTAAGDDVAYAWTMGSAHHFARRGALETVAATAVGTTLITQTILNYPRIALDSSGVLYLAYRDGGTSSIDWDVRLLVRPKGGSFGGAVNVSSTPGKVSDDIALTLEADGTLDIAWVEQNAADSSSFDVTYTQRLASGSYSPRQRFQQGLWAWAPSIVPGLGVAWRSGQGAAGPLYFGGPAQAPLQIMAPDLASVPHLARAPGGALHLVYDDARTPRRVQYARRL